MIISSNTKAVKSPPVDSYTPQLDIVVDNDQIVDELIWPAPKIQSNSEKVLVYYFDLIPTTRVTGIVRVKMVNFFQSFIGNFDFDKIKGITATVVDSLATLYPSTAPFTKVIKSPAGRNIVYFLFDQLLDYGKTLTYPQLQIRFYIEWITVPQETNGFVHISDFFLSVAGLAVKRMTVEPPQVARLNHSIPRNQFSAPLVRKKKVFSRFLAFCSSNKRKRS